VNGTDSNSKKPQVTFTAPGLYTVSLFVTANAITTNTTADTTKINYIQVTYPTGETQIAADDRIKVYPIPADQQLSCQLNGDANKQTTIELLDIMGNVVSAVTSSQHGVVDIATAQLPAGEYIIRVTPVGESSYMQKVSVVH
jgi:PKD repeat protein